jgi:triacylglycerol esterase/lipase EstA (alpha/beta hydrolase family)
MRLSARTLLRGLLVVQALLALGIAWALVRHGWSVAAAVPAGCGLVALVRLVINVNNFVVARFTASPTPAAYRIGPRGWLRMLAQEFWASMRATSWRMPRGRACMRVFRDSDRLPVLLVHGYGCNSGYWADLMPRLAAARMSYAAIDLEPLGGAIDAYVPQVEAGVRALCAATGSGQVAIVAHSMGGLVARAWLRAHGSARVARVITLGTPHHGTALARFGLGRNAAQMRRAVDGGTWLPALAASEVASEAADVPSLVTSIFSHHDNIVSPQTSSVLAAARTVAFGGIGHVALGSHPRVLAAVLHELDTVRRPLRKTRH